MHKFSNMPELWMVPRLRGDDRKRLADKDETVYNHSRLALMRVVMGKERQQETTIVFNKKATFDYFIENEYEAGLVLEGWEVKSLRAKKINLVDAHVIIKSGEAYLLGAQIQPLPTAALHLLPDASRTRKLLLNRKEINQLIGHVERQGYTLIPLSLYWKNNRVKMRLALAKGKKTHDKRDTIKDRDWDRERARLFKKNK